MERSLLEEQEQACKREAAELTSNFLGQLCDLWQELGLDANTIKVRFSTFISHTKDLYDQMIQEEKDLADKQRHKINILQQQLDTINNDLNMSESVNIDGLGLIPARHKLDECLDSLRTLHAKLQHERTQLEQKEKELCKQLGLTPSSRPDRFALCKETIMQLKLHIETLQKQKDDFMRDFLATREDIISLYAELEDEPQGTFEQSVVGPNTQKFPLDTDSLQRVEQLHTLLKNRVDQIREEVNVLRERLSQLWERLEVASEDREAFLDKFRGCSQSTRQALDKEIARCEELKHLNIERFIVRMRDELECLWKKCCVSEEEQAEFLPFSSSQFSDELLELHENEVHRLEEYYSANRGIFNLLQQRVELWNRVAQLEAKANDKERLFKNRGGQLLIEEKERKKLQRELPQVENNLKRMIEEWEQSSGEPFLLYGRRAIEVLQEQWDSYKMGKEQEKMQRKAAQQEQLERDAVMGTTMMSGANKRKLIHQTPEMQRKHPRMAPPPAKASASKAVRIAKNTSVRAQRLVTTRSTTRLPMPTNAARSQQTPQVALNVNYNINMVGYPQNRMEDSMASTISYSDFTHHLETRATRSSAVPSALHVTASRALSPLNTKTPKVRYPQSAPAKPPRQLRSTPKTPITTSKQPRTPRTAPKFTRTRNNLPIIF